MELNALPGAEVVVDLMGVRPIDIPQARLIVVFAWQLAVKDALVSVDLDESMAVIGTVSSLVGLICVILGIVSL